MERFAFNQSGQMSEAPITVFFLTLSGGMQDAYSYFVRGKVFANAQTGNIVLMSQHFFSGDPSGGLKYLIPLLAFSAGIFAAERIHASFTGAGRIHWRQVVVILEAMILGVVGLLPGSMDLAANALTSFCCAMQVEAFRKISGYGYASTMCIGNLRAGMESLSIYLRTHESEKLVRCLHYFGVIVTFALGAGLGSFLSAAMNHAMIWICSGFLLVSFVLMLKTESLQ
ncbi:MAG: YoaK family protein [Bulleidia sp.]